MVRALRIRYGLAMKDSLTTLVFMIGLSTAIAGQASIETEPPAKQQAGSSDAAVATPPDVTAPPVEQSEVDAAVAASVAMLLARQEGPTKAEWPYQGVYRVGATDDDPESLIEGRGRRRTVIPIGYRVGGTSIVGDALLRVPGCDEDEERRAALERARGFVVDSTSHANMNPKYGGGYDVRGWGYIYGCDFLLSMRERGFVADGEKQRHDEAIQFYLDGLEAIEIPEVGGWNYARRGPLSARSGTSPFMTPPGVQVLMEAERQGFPVAEGLRDRAMAALELTIGEEGVVAYSAQRKTRESPDMIPGAMGRMLAVETVRSETGVDADDAIRAALAAFVNHWDELLKRKQKNGTHVAPYGVAPYYFFYTHGYAAEAIERLPEAERAAWRDRLNRLLMSVRDEDGSWNDRVFPRSAAYGTAVTVLAFTEPGHAARTLNQPPPPQAPEPTVGEEAVSDDS